VIRVQRARALAAAAAEGQKAGMYTKVCPEQSRQAVPQSHTHTHTRKCCLERPGGSLHTQGRRRCIAAAPTISRNEDTLQHMSRTHKLRQHCFVGNTHIHTHTRARGDNTHTHTHARTHTHTHDRKTGAESIACCHISRAGEMACGHPSGLCCSYHDSHSCGVSGAHTHARARRGTLERIRIVRTLQSAGRHASWQRPGAR
jgi:hypothetical protein